MSPPPTATQDSSPNNQTSRQNSEQTESDLTASYKCYISLKASDLSSLARCSGDRECEQKLLGNTHTHRVLDSSRSSSLDCACSSASLSGETRFIRGCVDSFPDLHHHPPLTSFIIHQFPPSFRDWFRCCRASVEEKPPE